jgi:predicted extracellular nuclease
VIEGVVVGDFQTGTSLSGFYLQEEDPDADTDPMTSEGIFVYDGYSPAVDVQVGDLVRVRGIVAEYFNLTELTSVSDVEYCGTGLASPAQPTFPSSSLDVWEQYEGMLVTFTQPLYISEYYNFARYGEIVLTTDRQFQPTAIYDPGSVDAAQMLADNLLSRIKLDDGRGSQNPDPALHPNGGIFDLGNLFRGGDILNNLTGVVDYSYGEYKIQPTTGADYVSANPRTAQPDNVGGGLKVASFNVLNYFTTLDDGTHDICGPDGILECRGADTSEEFDRQRAKIIAALAAMDADVVGLIEIENNEVEAVADLVNGLNDAVGAGTYAYVDTGYIGTDAIKVAFIYKTGTVSLVGDHAILDESVDSRFIDTKNRPALAQSFMDNNTGGIFTAVVNHLKSKGSPCDDIGDPDLGDGAGNCNLTRTAAAEALVDWLWTDPTNSGDADFLIMGDLNAYDKEDPIDAILAGGYSDLVYEYVGENAYSYVFDGQLGYLDHALANDELGSEISGVTVWHINADEASLIDYDMSYKKDAQDLLYEPNAYRSSDHDPVVIGLNVCDEIAPTLEIELSTDTLWPANHKYMDVTATVTAADNFDLNPTVTLLSVTSSEADDENGDGDGSTVDDIVILDDYTFQLRAERSATNKDGRVYTITYQVTDACGNSTTASAEVTVPHNQGKDKDSNGEADSLDLPSETEAITPEPTPEPTEEPDVALTPEPTEEPSDKDKKDK